MGGAPATCSTRGVGSFRAPDRSADRMELRFGLLVHVRRDRYILNAKNKKKFQGGFDYRLSMACNWSFRQFGENLRRAPQAENQDDADNAVRVDDDVVGEDEDLGAVEWDPLSPHMEEVTVFASMSECINALVTYCIKVEHTFKVDKSDQVKVNPFKHTCQESTLRKDTISRAKSRWVAEEVKKWVKENQQVGPKELQKNIKDKFKIDLPYMKLFNDPAFRECFEEGFDENVGQQPVAATYDENDGQQRVASDEDFHEVPNDDGQQSHDFDDDLKYPPNGVPSEAPNGDPSEAPNGDQPSVVASSARYLYGSFEEDAQGTDNQEEKRRSNEHKVHEEQSDGKKLKDQTQAATLFMKLLYPSGVLVEKELRVWATSRWRGAVKLTRAFLREGYVHLPQGSPRIFTLNEVRDRAGTLLLLTVTFDNHFDARELLGRVYWCGCESIFFTVYNIFTNY
ncbi:hypothetical protein D1007_02298 [Hordeum vulgare]|nr:hypothetical protein D1007_02298 [Hordeum vulgare]